MFPVSLFKPLELIDRHRTGRPLDLNALPRQFIELFPADLDCRHHRRYLHQLACKTRKYGFQIVRRRDAVMYAHGFPFYVISIRFQAEPQGGDVGLLTRQAADQFGI
jgi:hypothetical protein